uniref:WD_REPEATS_REGION domain-containing protein n=1 Tax=Strongyloides papillosus TaxID=174720 RepID=A0A0N5BJY8_STREA
MFSNIKVLKEVVDCIPQSVDFGFTTVDICYIITTSDYLIFISKNGIVFPFFTSNCQCQSLPYIKFPTKSGTVSAIRVEDKLNYIAIGFDSGVVYILKLDDNCKPLKIDGIHDGRSIVDMIWSEDGNYLYIGDNWGHITLILINWISRIIQYKYLCIDGMPIVKMIVNKKESKLFYITNFSFVSLDLSDIYNIQRKVFNFEDDREELEYRGLLFLHFTSAEQLNEINVIDNEGFVYVFDLNNGKLKKQYSLDGCENIENCCLIPDKGIIFKEYRSLKYFVFEEVNDELILSPNNVWNIEDFNQVSFPLLNEDDEDLYNIVDICYHKQNEILFCLINPGICIAFSENSKNSLFLEELCIQESTKSEFLLTTEILNFTASTTKELIDKKMPSVLAKLDKIKNVASEKVVEKLEEARDGKFNDYIELPNTSLEIVYPFNVFKEISDDKEDSIELCVSKKPIKVKKNKKPYDKKLSSIEYLNEKISECNDNFPNLIEVSNTIINNTRPIRKKSPELSQESFIEIKTNYEYELEYQQYLLNNLPLKDDINKKITLDEECSSISIRSGESFKVKPFSISMVNEEIKDDKLINTSKCDIKNYINLSCHSISWNYFSLPYQIHSFTITSNFLITTSTNEWRCDYIELNNDKKWKKCINYPNDIIISNHSGTLLWKITKGKAFSPQCDNISNLSYIFSDYCDWKCQTPNDYVYDASFVDDDVWYLTKQGPFVKMNLPTMNILYHTPIKYNKNIVFDKISASSNGVWILSTGKCIIYARVGLHKCQMGVEWIKVKSIKRIPYNIVSIALHATFAFALDSSGCLWMLPDVTKKNALGSKKGWYKMYFDFILPKNTILMSDIDVSSKGMFIKNGCKLFYTSSGFINAHQFYSYDNHLTFYNFQKISNLSSNEVVLLHTNGDFYIFNTIDKKYKVINTDSVENCSDNKNINKIMMSNTNSVFFLNSSGSLWIHQKPSSLNYMTLNEWELISFNESIGDNVIITDFTLTNDILFIVINNRYLYKYHLATRQISHYPDLPEEVGDCSVFVSKTTSIIIIGDKKKFIYFSYSLKNNNWIKINNNSYDELISKIVVGDNVIWGLSQKLGSLYYLENFDETVNPKGDRWRKAIDIKIIDIALNLDDGNELLILDKKGILKKHDIISLHLPFNDSLNFTIPSSEKSIIYQEYISSFNVNSSPLKNNIQSQDINVDNDALNSISINSFLQIVPKIARKTISGVTSKIFNH